MFVIELKFTKNVWLLDRPPPPLFQKRKVSLGDEKVVRGADMGQRPPSPPGRGGALDMDSILLGQKRQQRQNMARIVNFKGPRCWGSEVSQIFGPWILYTRDQSAGNLARIPGS